MDEWEYPKSLYRAGGTELIWGKPVETLIVSSRGEETEALALGWCLCPAECDVISVEVVEAPKQRLKLKAE